MCVCVCVFSHVPTHFVSTECLLSVCACVYVSLCVCLGVHSAIAKEGKVASVALDSPRITLGTH